MIVIDVEAYLEYCNGDSISGGPEALRLIVKFKERHKFFRTKLEKRLVSTPWLCDLKFESYEDYLSEVELYMNDTYLVMMEAEKMVKQHFASIKKENINFLRVDLIKSKVKTLGKIKINVNIK
jgi:hypothetical protein